MKPALLKKEIEFERLPIQLDPKQEEIVLAELCYALAPPIHEQKAPLYGCLLFPCNYSFKGKRLDINILKELANGRDALLVRDKQDFEMLFLEHPLKSELDVISLQKKFGGFVIQRIEGDVVKFFTKKYIIINQKRRWFVKPLATSYKDRIVEVAPQAASPIMESILEFAFHYLSASNVGSTILWNLDEKSETLPHTEKSIDISSFNLNISKRAYYGALNQLLSQHDGAVLIARDGTIQAIEIFLRPTEQSQKLIKKERGTRHTSAKRYSFDVPQIIAFVVFEDGEVSVYSDGINILNIHIAPLDEGERWRKSIPEKKNDIFSEYYIIQCSKCGKTFRVEVVTIIGWKDHEDASCLVCGNELMSENCFSINIRPLKVW